MKLKHKKLVVMSIIVLSLCGCLQINRGTTGPYEDVEHDNKLKPKDFSAAIKQTEDIARTHYDLSVRRNAHLQLAQLYSSYKNPTPNYQSALKELDIYVSSNPEDVIRDDIQDLLSILREMDKMKQKIVQLGKENKELREMLEQLKKLDITIENKRKKAK